MWHNTSVGLSSIWLLKCFHQVIFGAYWLGQFTLTFVGFSHWENWNDGDNCFYGWQIRKIIRSRFATALLRISNLCGIC